MTALSDRIPSRIATVLAIALAIGSASGCSKRGSPPAPPPAGTQTIKSYAVNAIDGAIRRDGVAFDAEISSDGAGSLRFDAPGGDSPATFAIYETGDVDVEDAIVIYEARVRTEGVGRAYLEMWAVLPEGEFFSRGLDSPATGTSEWTTLRTPFRFEKGQNPTDLRLNLVVEGGGKVWIDEIRVVRAPLDGR